MWEQYDPKDRASQEVITRYDSYQKNPDIQLASISCKASVCQHPSNHVSPSYSKGVASKARAPNPAFARSSAVRMESRQGHTKGKNSSTGGTAGSRLKANPPPLRAGAPTAGVLIQRRELREYGLTSTLSLGIRSRITLSPPSPTQINVTVQYCTSNVSLGLRFKRTLGRG